MKGCNNIKRLQFSSVCWWPNFSAVTWRSFVNGTILRKLVCILKFVNLCVANLLLAYHSSPLSTIILQFLLHSKTLFLPLVVDWPWPTAEQPPGHLLNPPPSRLRERIGRAKVRKLVGSDKDSLSEGKRRGKTQRMQKQSLTTSHVQTDAQPSLRTMAALEGPNPQFLLLSMMPSGMDYPRGRFGSTILALFPPNLLSTPSLLVAV